MTVEIDYQQVQFHCPKTGRREEIILEHKATELISRGKRSAGQPIDRLSQHTVNECSGSPE